MIVAGVGFVVAVFARGHPIGEVVEPLLETGKSFRRHGGRFFHRDDGARNFDEMQRVNDARAAPRRNAGNGLGILKAQIHARPGIEEEDAEQRDGLRGVFVIAGDFVSLAASKRGDGGVHFLDGLAVLGEVAGIGFAVALDVGKAVGL